MNSKTSLLSPHSKDIKGILEPAILKRLQKEKRGQGYGKDYNPFLTVWDVPSKGRVHRRPALTHNRIVHILSDLELAVFLLFDWNTSVTDIREQFPLNPEATIDIAKRLGIKHPAYKGILQVMTTDFLIDMEIDGLLGKRPTPPSKKFSPPLLSSLFFHEESTWHYRTNKNITSKPGKPAD
ncbi:hypothetical protein [Methylotuvimicrobium sp.]|uniref:hypothetical protein n=1 Tax=Methylotuvimicrobium sp. TaxID=2822413 RepID=UPI003D65DD57